MKIKKEYLILVIVIIALAAYLSFRTTDRSQYSLPVLEPVSTEAVSKIGIKGTEGHVEIEKSDGKWFVLPDKYPVNTGKVKAILEVASQLKLTALVSESKNYDRYDLTDEKKTAVRVWAGDQVVLELDVGKTASSFRHTFVKIAGDHRVYHARENFRNTFEETVDSIRDKTVLGFEVKDVRKIVITKNGRPETFTRVETVAPAPDPTSEEAAKEKPAAEKTPLWKRSNDDKIDIEKVNRFLSTLEGLECDRYIYGRKKADLKNPIFSVTLEGTRNHTLHLFEARDKAGENFPAVSSQNDYPFELVKYRAEDIMKGLDEEEKPADK